MIFVKDAVREGLEESLIASIVLAEVILGYDLEITSARRADEGAHGLGLAVDIRCHHARERWDLVEALRQAGVRRIGIYDRHIHADRDLSRPQDVMWWGESK